jgi:hypothetical protein
MHSSGLLEGHLNLLLTTLAILLGVLAAICRIIPSEKEAFQNCSNSGLGLSVQQDQGKQGREKRGQRNRLKYCIYIANCFDEGLAKAYLSRAELAFGSRMRRRGALQARKEDPAVYAEMTV